jgi:hypothetical protein
MPMNLSFVKVLTNVEKKMGTYSIWGEGGTTFGLGFEFGGAFFGIVFQFLDNI